VQGNSRIRLADKHKLLVKDDIGILVKSLTEICDNRISSFAADFNTLYMSKIAEADRPGPSAANVQAAQVSNVSPAPSTSNAHFNSGSSGRYNVTPAASVSRSGNFYEPNYDQDVGNSSVPSQCHTLHVLNLKVLHQQMLFIQYVLLLLYLPMPTMLMMFLLHQFQMLVILMIAMAWVCLMTLSMLI